MIRNLSEKRVAYHEAGHVVVYCLMDLPIKKVTILPEQTIVRDDIPATLHGHVIPIIQPYPACNLAIIDYAGPIAEAKYRHCAYSRCFEENTLGDLKHANDMIMIWHKSGFVPGHTLEYWCSKFAEDTRVVINHQWDEVKMIANELIKRKTLTNDEVIEIIKSLKK
jgi:hypothetical protein